MIVELIAFFKKKKCLRVYGEVAQSVKCLLKKHEDIGLTLRSRIKKPGMVACTCNRNTVEAETGGFLESPGQLS